MMDLVGYSTERFLNLAINRDIYIWNIEKHDKKISLNVSIKGYKMLKSCARKTSCKIKIQEKIGLPFILDKYRKRKMLPIGLVMFVCLIYVMSLFIWKIEIDGNHDLDSYEVSKKLSENGFETGKLKIKTDLRKAENIILANFPEVIWTGIEFIGTKMVINIKESIQEPVILDKSVPIDIVAKTDGLILDVVTRTGTPMVKYGDTVKKGDVLVSSHIEVSEDGDFDYIRASADITAKTNYIIKTKLNWDYNKKVYTGKLKRSYYIKVFNKKTKLFEYNNKFDKSNKVVKIKHFKIAPEIFLPISIIQENTLEYKLAKRMLSDIDAKDKLTIKLDEILNEEIDLDGEIIKSDVTFKKNKKEIIGILNTVVKQELGKEKIVKSNIERNKVDGKEADKH